MEKTCTKCNQLKDISNFSSKGADRLTSMCKPCDAERVRLRRETHGRRECPHKAAKRRIKNNQKDRVDRACNNRLGQFVLYDCRSSDSKKGRECDLDREFVENMMSLPCNYCGVTAEHAKITLDRIDNSLGHLKTNVVTACYRCNLMRSDMPYVAWLLLVPAIRSARLTGAFGEWRAWPKTIRPSEATDAEIEEAEGLDALPTTSTGRLVNKVTDEDFLEALRTSPSICQALQKLGLAPKGKNYVRAKRLLGIEGTMSRSKASLDKLRSVEK